MSTDPGAPATKEDIRLLMEQMGTYYANTADRFAAVEQRIEELHEHFGVVAENIKHDFRGAFADKLDQHEDRIVRLERRAGLRAA
jgi:hypothetical protein